MLFVSGAVHVVGFIKEVPDMNTFVVFEMGDDADDIILQFIMSTGIAQNFDTGALHPARIMHVPLWITLLAKLRKWIPDRVKVNKHHTDLVSVRDGQKFFNPLEVGLFILFPDEVMKKNADAGKTEICGPAEFAIDRLRIPRFGLPHLELIDGAGWAEIAANQPGLFRIPVIGLLRGPLVAGCCRHDERASESSKQEKAFHDLELFSGPFCFDVEGFETSVRIEF